jgi:hypothetical protein
MRNWRVKVSSAQSFGHRQESTCKAATIQNMKQAAGITFFKEHESLS